MSTTKLDVGDPEVATLWAEALSREQIRATAVGQFISRKDDNLIKIQDDLSKKAGSTARMTFRRKLTGDGTLNDSTLEGNEESLVTSTQDMTLGQLRHAVRSDGAMTDQYSLFDIRMEAKDGLGKWFVERDEKAIFNHLCGYTPANTSQGLAHTALNTVLAPDSAHKLMPAGISDENDLTSSHPMTLATLSKARAMAKLMTPIIEPVLWRGQKLFVAYLHTAHIFQLKTEAGAAGWLEITKALYQGSKESNPIVKGSANMIGDSEILGIYDNVLIVESSFVTPGVTNAGASKANTRRSILCGKGAGYITYGRKGPGGRMTWKEKYFDYDNQLGVSAGKVYGFVKAQYDIDGSGTARDMGIITIPRYADDTLGT